MNKSISKKQWAEVISELLSMGIEDLQSVIWLRSPVRINGVWRAEVRV